MISPPTFLKALGPRARQELLGIFNRSFFSGKSPQIWKITIILPLKKAGKPSGCISSYKPVRLTSCVAKTLERILLNRLYYLADTRDWLCTEKAGFRNNRSCASRSGSVTVIRPPSGRRLSWPFKTTQWHLTVSGRKTCLSEQLTKASRLHMRSGSATSSQTEKPKSKSTETETDSYHYARDSLKGPSCHRSSFCCTPTTFGGSYPKT